MLNATKGLSTYELSPGQEDQGHSTPVWRRKIIGLLIGPVLALVVFAIMPQDLSEAARTTAAVGVLMGVWWVTEAVPIPITALLPLVIFPMLGVVEMDEISVSYASSTVFLFLGGFLLALTLERWNLHKRIALKIVLLIGTRPTLLVGGFMIATALLSMWVSNTATAMMMIPMGMSVLSLVNDRREGLQTKSNFGVALMLGIAYAATIGAFGTMIGSPTNIVTVGYIRESLGYDITFLQWMAVGVPLMIVMLVLGWLVLTKWVWKPEVDELPGGRELFENQLRGMGPMSTGEKLTSVCFALTALSWVFVPVIFEDPWATDAVIAMMVGIGVFLIPAAPKRGVMLMNWGAAKKIPWDVLLLFGGGLALSSQITSSGLSEWIGHPRPDRVGL